MLINDCRPENVLCRCTTRGARMRRTDEFVSHGTTCVYVYECRNCGARVSVSMVGRADTPPEPTTRPRRARTRVSDLAERDTSSMSVEEWRSYCRKRGAYDDLRFLRAAARKQGQDDLVRTIDERLEMMTERGKVTPDDRRFAERMFTRWRRARHLAWKDQYWEVAKNDYWARLPRVHRCVST